jgi:hypothetical protein
MARSAAVVAVALVAGAGCMPRPGATYSLHTDLQLDLRAAGLEPEVVTSETGAAMTAEARTVALRPPDYCSGASAAETSNHASGPAEAVVLQMDCGVPMAELERAFVRHGYQVLHWNRVLEVAREEEQARQAAGKANVNPKAIDVALQTLGVDLVVSVNSLEKTETFIATHAKWQRRYFRATDRGGEVGEALVEPGLADAMDAFLRAQEANIMQATIPSVTVDLTVVKVPSSEAVWFYRGARVWSGADQQLRFGRRYFATCGMERVPNIQYYCRALPPPADYAEDRRPPRNGSSRTIELNSNADAVQRSIYWQLIREVMEDVARRFRNGPEAGLPLPELAQVSEYSSAGGEAPPVPGSAAQGSQGAAPAPEAPGSQTQGNPPPPPSDAPSWLQQ